MVLIEEVGLLNLSKRRLDMIIQIIVAAVTFLILAALFGGC